MYMVSRCWSPRPPLITEEPGTGTGSIPVASTNLPTPVRLGDWARAASRFSSLARAKREAVLFYHTLDPISKIVAVTNCESKFIADT